MPKDTIPRNPLARRPALAAKKTPSLQATHNSHMPLRILEGSLASSAARAEKLLATTPTIQRDEPMRAAP